ncbi:MAG: hypothetical protein LBS21_07595 [Clostridiales bacterium]|jgi:hypothetical protein|nr:hypothetical protein [Clostridiales bacterium]
MKPKLHTYRKLTKKTGIISAFIITLIFCVNLNTAELSAANRQVPVSAEAQLIYAAKNIADGDIITLEADIFTEKTIYFDLWNKQAVLDLNGHRLDIQSAKSNAIRIDGFGGKLTVTDSKEGGFLSAKCLYTGDEQGGVPRDTSAIRVSNSAQELTLNKVSVEAFGGTNGPGIGAVTAEPGTIIIKDSNVAAKGGPFGAGIGGGINRGAGNIIIESGNIGALGGDFAAAIGTGGATKLTANPQEQSSVVIAGGIVAARGGLNAAGIGGGQYRTAGDVKIEGGKITAYGGNRGAGIGTGNMNAPFKNEEFVFAPSGIYLAGGNISAQGGEFAAGVGTGEGSSNYAPDIMMQNRLIKIDGANIVSAGGIYGAGIGGGAYFSGGKIEVAQTVNDTYVEAAGGSGAAGVGGGSAGLTGDFVRVYGGKLEARGGDLAAGIGSGEFSLQRLEPVGEEFLNLKNIIITGGEVSAKAGKNAAAIGGGSNASGSDVVFSGNAKVIAESAFENSIGAGANAVSQGSVTIDGGNILLNGKIGPVPKNSNAQPLYEGEINVVSSVQGLPLKDAEITADLNGYKYTALTGENGKAHVYLPQEDNVLIEVTSDAAKPVTAEFGGGRTQIVLNEERVKLLSDNYTYFTDLHSNTFPIEYEGSAEGLRFEAGNSEGIDINSQTGLMTFPVQLKHGSYNFPVYAYAGDRLLDEVDFKLSVVESIKGVNSDNLVINALPNKNLVLNINPEPLHSAVSEVFWKVTFAENGGCELNEKPKDSGEYAAEFTAQLPGRYSVTATLIDANENTASAVFDIDVADKYKIDPREIRLAAEKAQLANDAPPVENTPFANGAPPAENTPFADDARDAVAVFRTNALEAPKPPEIVAYTAERISPSKVYIDFYATGGGLYFYEVVKSGGVPTGKYTGGYTCYLGNNRIESVLSDEGAYDVYVVIEDNDGYASKPMRIRVDEYKTPDIIPPEVTDLKALRDEESAVISFVSNKDGYFKYAAFENGISAVSAGNSYGRPAQMKKGQNEFTVKGLKAGETCDIKLTAFDDVQNATPEYLFSVDAYKVAFVNTLPENPAVRLTGISSKRETANRAWVNFYSDSDGVLNYAILREADGEPEYYSHTEIIYEGRNRIYLDNLTGGEKCYFAALAQDNKGGYGEVFKVEIGEY